MRSVNKYRSKKKTAIEALEEIDTFMTRMEMFMNRHPKYSYKVYINKNLGEDGDIYKWNIELNIFKNE